MDKPVRDKYSSVQLHKPFVKALSRFARYRGFSQSGLVRAAVLFFEQSGCDLYMKAFKAGQLDLPTIESNFIKKYSSSK